MLLSLWPYVGTTHSMFPIHHREGSQDNPIEHVSEVRIWTIQLIHNTQWTINWNKPLKTNDVSIHEFFNPLLSNHMNWFFRLHSYLYCTQTLALFCSWVTQISLRPCDVHSKLTFHLNHLLFQRKHSSPLFVPHMSPLLPENQNR